MKLSGIEIIESELKYLLNNKELVFYREIKSIPNQVLGLELKPTVKCFELTENNPYNEPIYYQIRYNLDVSGTWNFRKRYGLSLNKNIYSKYGLNEVLYIKEPFLVSDNGQIYYDYLNSTKEHKCLHQRYMKQEEARYFIQIINVEIEKIENYYINNEDDFTKTNFLNEDNNFLLPLVGTEKQEKTVNQQFYSHKYQLKYTCKLLDKSPFEKFIPSNKIRYFYRVQIPFHPYEGAYISWKDFKVGYIEAQSQKEARKLIEEEFDCDMPSKIIKEDSIGSKYKYILKIFPPDTYWDKYWGGTRVCPVCGNEFTIIDKINHFGDKSIDCCSPDCDDVENQKNDFLKEEIYVKKLINEEKSIHQPCIYLISNLKTGKVYVGQTTQYSTFRWYQHFKNPYSGSKFHNAILDHNLTDWSFQVIEIINDETLKENNISFTDKSNYINKREQFWINHYDSIVNGYNTATANKELSDTKKNVGIEDLSKN